MQNFIGQSIIDVALILMRSTGQRIDGGKRRQVFHAFFFHHSLFIIAILF